MATDPDLREYRQMTEVLRGPGGPLDHRGRGDLKKLNQRDTPNWRRVQAAQGAIQDIGSNPENAFTHREAVNRLEGAGIPTKGKMAIHPLTGRRVLATKLALEIDWLADTLDIEDWGGIDQHRFNSAAKTLKSGKISGAAGLPPVPPGDWMTDAEVGSWRERAYRPAIEEMRGGAADTHLKRNLRGFAQRQRVSADIADPSVMEGMRGGVQKADRSATRKLAAGVMRGTGRLAGGALGLAGSLPADIALRAMGRPDDMTVTEDYRGDEQMITEALGLAERGGMPVTSLTPARRRAAMQSIRSGREGLRPPHVEGEMQEAITDEEIQFLLREMADPGIPTANRPRHEAPKAAPRTKAMK